MNTTTKTLFPAEVQLAIFQQLLTYEHLLEDECYLDIQKYAPDQMMRVTLWEKAKPHEIPQDDPSKCWHVHRPHLFNLMRIHTARELDEAISRWWENIPKEWKR